MIELYIFNWVFILKQPERTRVKILVRCSMRNHIWSVTCTSHMTVGHVFIHDLTYFAGQALLSVVVSENMQNVYKTKLFFVGIPSWINDIVSATCNIRAGNVYL